MRSSSWGHGAVVAAVVAVWYATNGGFAVFAKLELSSADDPTRRAHDLTILQFSVGGLAGLIYACFTCLFTSHQDLFSNVQKVVSLNGGLLTIVHVSALHLLGGLFTNIAYAHASAAATQVLKASEPIITVVLVAVLTGVLPNKRALAGVLLIPVGILIFTMGDKALSFDGVRYTALSSLCLPIRNIFGKNLNQAMGSANTFVVATWGAQLLYVPIYCSILLCSGGSMPSFSSKHLLLAAICYTAYNCASFIFLGMFTPVTHSVANGLKRVVSIIVAAAYFQSSLPNMFLPGLLVLFAGIGLYIMSKYTAATDSSQKLSDHDVKRPFEPNRGVTILLALAFLFLMYRDSSMLCVQIKDANHTVANAYNTVDIPTSTNFLDSFSLDTSTFRNEVIESAVEPRADPSRNHDELLNSDCLMPRLSSRHSVIGPFALPKLAGTKCDDGNISTFMDACDGTGICSGTVKYFDKDPLRTQWFLGNDALWVFNRNLHSESKFDSEDKLLEAYPTANKTLILQTSRNFGDEIGPLLMSWMSGRKTAFDPKTPNYLVVGSVADWVTKYNSYGKWNVTLWGPGSKMNVAWKLSATAKAVCLDYRSFRGPYTRSLCIETGCGCPDVYGDPALLLPFFYLPKPNPKVKLDVCIIPHINEYTPRNPVEGWLHATGLYSVAENTSLTGNKGTPARYFPPYGVYDGVLNGTVHARFIDIRLNESQYDIFIDSLVDCPWVATSSLHGAILAEAYRIPWRLIVFEGKVPSEKMFKYEDFMLSIGIHYQSSVLGRRTALKEYSPNELQKMLNLKPTIAQFTDRSSPLVDYEALINACPFVQPEVRNRLLRAIRSRRRVHPVGIDKNNTMSTF